jgi:hypothetical protein
LNIFSFCARIVSFLLLSMCCKVLFSFFISLTTS